MMELIVICITIMVVVAIIGNTTIEIYKIKKRPNNLVELLGGNSNSEKANPEE